MKNLTNKLRNCILISRREIKISRGARIKVSTLLLCAAALMTCVSMTFAWFGSSFENLNTRIKMGEYSARISVYDENAELITVKTAKNGETVSFDSTTEKTGWPSGKTGVYYLYVENLGDIDFVTSVSLSGSFTPDNEQLSAFCYELEDITSACEEANGFENYISGAKARDIDYILKNGISFDNAGLENMSETKTDSSSAYALYYGCNSLPDKYYDGNSVFGFSAAISTTQSLAPRPTESAVQNAVIAESTTAPAESAQTTQAAQSEEKSESTVSTGGSENPSNSEWEWKYNDQKRTTATLVKYKGTKKEVVLPATADGALVTALGDKMFAGTAVEKVTVPASVSKFETDTFTLKTLKVLELQPKTMVGDRVYTSSFTFSDGMVLTFDGTALVRVLSQLCPKELTLNREITAIYGGAFAGCNSLEKLNVKSVGVFSADAFDGCAVKELCLYNDSPVNASGQSAFGKKSAVTVHVKASLAEQYKNSSALSGYKVKYDLKDDIYESVRYTEIDSIKYVLLQNGDSFNGVEYAIEGEKEFAVIAECRAAEKTLVVPETITCDGKAYKVAALDDNAVSAKTAQTIETLVLPSRDFIISYGALSECKKLKTVEYAE